MIIIALALCVSLVILFAIMHPKFSEWQNLRFTILKYDGTWKSFTDTHDKIKVLYPAKWQIDETPGGVSMQNFEAAYSGGIGTLETGQYDVEISPPKLSSTDIDSWCKDQLYTFIGKDTEISNVQQLTSNILMFDFTNRSDDRQNGEFGCVDYNNWKLTIFGYPLNANYRNIFQTIVTSVSILN
jgi:hypothetical protein